MANIKISELTALTPPDAADLVPVTDSSASQTKRTTVGEIVGIVNGDVDVANDGTATISELPVSKLQDGAARQLLQTDAAGTGVEWTSNVDVPGTLDVTGATTLDSTLGVTGQSTLASAAVSDLTSGRVVLAGTSGELEDSAALTFNGTQLDVDGNVVITGDLTVEGASTILETEIVKVEDKNIELGAVTSPTDVTADGGGITLKGTTDKTINWVDATDAWTSSERFSVPLGSQATPSLTFTGDPNTGLYSPGADQLALSTNGLGRVFVDANGQVTVKSTLPSVELRDQSTNDFLASIASFANKASLDAGRVGGTAIPLVFGTDLNERMRITSAGLVGIGTSSPVGNLDVTFSNSTGYSSSNMFAGGISQYIYNSSTTNGVASTLALAAKGPGTTAQAAISAIYASTGVGHLAFGTRAGGNVIERMRVTSTGLGIGTASPSNLLTVSGTGNVAKFISSGSDVSLRFQNASSNAGYLQYTSDNLAFWTNNTERARIDSSGRLLVGTSSARQYTLGGAGYEAGIQFAGSSVTTASTLLTRDSNDGSGYQLYLGKTRATSIGSYANVIQDDELGAIIFGGANESQFRPGAVIEAFVDGEPSTGGDTTDMPGRLVFSTTADGASSPTERMRIAANGSVATFCSSGTDGIWAGSAATAGTARSVFIGSYGASGVYTGTISVKIFSNGDIQNTNNSYGALSDIKLKENIVDANSQWDDIKALRPVNYNFKEGQTHTQLGLIAQEVELVSPGLVTESPDRDAEGNDLGTVTKSVNYSVLYMKAVKALQEAMERIETLEAKVAALESA